MLPAEVVKGKPQRQSCLMILPLLGERIGEPRESSRGHSQGQIGPFDGRAIIPYWVFAVPTTIVSAGLILWPRGKPRNVVNSIAEKI
jgi:hypothetical protein